MLSKEKMSSKLTVSLCRSNERFFFFDLVFADLVLDSSSFEKFTFQVTSSDSPTDRSCLLCDSCFFSHLKSTDRSRGWLRFGCGEGRSRSGSGPESFLGERQCFSLETQPCGSGEPDSRRPGFGVCGAGSL